MSRISLKKQYVPIVCVVAVGVFLSFLIFFALRNREKLDIQAEIRLASQRMTHELQRRIDTNIEALLSCYSFYQSSQEVTRDEFRKFVSHILSRHAIIQAIAWIPQVKFQQLTKFETSARASGFDNFVITEQDNEHNLVFVKKRDEYYPVFFIEPFERNESALGYDLASDPVGFKALLKARDSGETAVSSVIKFAQETNNQKSILVFMPLYKRDVVIDSVEQRRNNFEGLVLAVLRLPELFANEDEYLEKQNMGIFYNDDSAEPANKLIYRRLCHNTASCKKIRKKKNIFCSFSYPLTIADRTWSVVYEVYKSYFPERSSWHPFFILLCFLLITGLLAGYLIINYRRTSQVEELADILIDKNQELETVNNELDDFVYTASHDLSSPLRTITAFANILKEDYSDVLTNEGNDIIGRIIKGTNQMDRVIKDLLELSRISRVKNPYEFVDFNSLIISVKDRVCINDDQLKVQFKIAENFPEVYCDQIKICELFFNLINNAVKFSSKKKGQVPSVEIGYCGKDEFYEFFVKDNGIGIEKKYQDKIFGLFVRLHSESEYEGTGLGLAIVKKIVDEHSGRIWVESEENKWAAFYFALPKK